MTREEKTLIIEERKIRLKNIAVQSHRFMVNPDNRAVLDNNIADMEVYNVNPELVGGEY